MGIKSLILSALDNRWIGGAVSCLGSVVRHRPHVLGFKNPLFVSHYVVHRGRDRYIAPNDSFIARGAGKDGLVRFPAGVYEPEISYLVEGLIHPSDTVLDIGANAGLHTVSFARLAGPEGRVYAFEPVTEMAERCSLNCALSRRTNVTILNCALGDDNRELTMNVNVAGHGMEGTSSFLRTVHVEARPRHYTTRTVPVRRLDDLVAGGVIQGRIGFIKIDTEGFEPMILRGSLKTIHDHRPAMIVEAHSRRLRDAGLTFAWYRETFPEYHAVIVYGTSPANPFLRLEPLGDEPPEIAVNLLLLPRTATMRPAPPQEQR